MELEFDIVENNLATELYFIDASEWDNSVYIDNVSSITITFQSLILPDNTLCESVDGTTSVTFSKLAPTESRFEITNRYLGAIYPSDVDVNGDWTIFPEGIYNFSVSVVVDQGTEPTNNPLQYGEVLYAQTREYRDQLVHQIARNVVNELSDDNFTFFTLYFDSIFQALKNSVDITGTGLELTPGNVITPCRLHRYLIDSRNKYPIGTKVKRYYDNRTLR